MLAALRNRNIALLVCAGLISAAGDWALIIALPVFVYDLTGSTLATGAMFVASSAPRLLFGALAGVFVDRWDRRKTMIGADLARAALLPMLLLVSGEEWLPLLYLVAGLQATLALFFGPAERAILPQLVDEQHLLGANGLRSLSWELTRLFAPLLGGGVMAASGITGVVLLDCASFLLSALLIALLPRIPVPAREDPPAGPLRDLGDGLRLVRSDRLTLTLFVLLGVATAGEGIVNVLGFPWLAQVLQGGAAERGWLASAQAVGGLIGGLLIAGAGRALPYRRLIAAGGALFGLSSLLLTNIAFFAPPAEWLMPLALLLRILSGLTIVAFYLGLETLLQSHIAAGYRGRVFGALGTTNGLLLLLGQGLAGLLGDVVGVVLILSLQGVLYLAAGLAALWLLPSNMMRPTTH